MSTCTKSFVFSKHIKLLCVSIFMFGASMAYAEPATVIDGNSCITFIPSVGLLFTETEGHKVITDKGVTVLTCQFEHSFDLEYAVGDQGFVCGVKTLSGDVILTNDSQNIAVPGGRGALTCKVNGAEVNGVENY